MWQLSNMTRFRLQQRRSYARVHLEFPGGQSWRVRNKKNCIPVFLSSQDVFGAITVLYEDAVNVQIGDHVSVEFTGTHVPRWIC